MNLWGYTMAKIYYLFLITVLRLFTVVRFQNVPCIGPNLENGTCYHGKECADLGGLGTSPCAQGLGVCCLCMYSLFLKVDTNCRITYVLI